MIKDAIDTLDADTVMVLVNAICFEGEWAEEYEDSQVSESFFTSADGSSKEAMFLHDTSSAYYETDKATDSLSTIREASMRSWRSFRQTRASALMSLQRILPLKTTKNL